MEAQPIVLPISTVQPDFTTIAAEVRDGVVPEDSFWLSCYKAGEPSVHGRVRAALDEHDRNLVVFDGRDGVDFRGYVNDVYSVECPSLKIPRTRIAVPGTSYTDSSIPDAGKSRQITAFDVAPDGSQFATAYHDGSVHLRSVSSPIAVSIAKPHLTTVTSLSFFPSSRVLLTAGVDFSLSILPAEPPAPSSTAPTAPLVPVRTLRGHTRGVMATAIIARGRTLLSGSKDSTLRLWDVPSGAQIRTLHTAAPVLALSLGERLGVAADGPEDTDPREVGTGDQLALAGLADGALAAFDLRVKRAVAHARAVPGAGALNTVDYAPEHGLVATGAARGLIAIYDVRALGGPVATFRRNEAAVEDVRFVGLGPGAFSLSSGSETGETAAEEVGLAIATEDGLPYVASVRPEGPAVRAELVGPDCDGVRAVRVVRGEVWTAADDGVVRQYPVR